jgi:ribose-phosphate pyrophosphokinase
VAGAKVLLLDDLIASGKTVCSAAQALRHVGAGEVIAFAAHGLFTSPAAQVLTDPAITSVIVTDSVPPFRLPPDSPATARIAVVSAAPLFAQAIRASPIRRPG